MHGQVHKETSPGRWYCIYKVNEASQMTVFLARDAQSPSPSYTQMRSGIGQNMTCVCRPAVFRGCLFNDFCGYTIHHENQSITQRTLHVF